MRYFISLLFACVICSCGSEKSYPKAENALDAGREFIDGCLKGDFERANFYMVDDARNQQLLEKQKNSYQQKKKEEKDAYATASITIFEDAVLDDSTHIMNFQNSYDKMGRKVKVILQQGKWMVDFKYTFDGNL